MPSITPPTLETVAACVERAARIGPLLGGLTTRYTNQTLPNDPEVSRALQQAGMTILPGIRLEDSVETAMWAHGATEPETFASYVRQSYAEGRINHAACAAADGRAMHTTRDGYQFTDLAVHSLIGASLPTPKACKEAVRLLYSALTHGVTHGELWELSRLAVWESLDAAREALAALRAGRAIMAPTLAPMRLTATLMGVETWVSGSLWDAVQHPVATNERTAPVEDAHPFAHIS